MKQPANRAELSETEICEHCNGKGEVIGYGGNYIPCGLCAGTGKKVIFSREKLNESTRNDYDN